MVQDLQIAIQGSKGAIDWESISAPSPATIEEMITLFEDYSKKFKRKLKNMKPDKFKKSKVEFFIAPQKLGKIPIGENFQFITGWPEQSFLRFTVRRQMNHGIKNLRFSKIFHCSVRLLN